MPGITSRWANLSAQLVLTVLAIIFAAPLVIMIRVSLQGDGLGNYLAVLQHPLIPRFFLNSVVVTALTIALTYVVTILAAYALAKLKLRGRMLMFNLILVGLMVPAIAVVVPLFVLFRNLQLFNTYWALVLPYTAFGLPFTLLLMRNFLDGLPDELLDAARIDGCNSFTALVWIVVPLSKSISLVVIIWTFLSAWNEYFLALIFMREAIHADHHASSHNFSPAFTTPTSARFLRHLVLISLPVMITYLSLQKVLSKTASCRARSNKDSSMGVGQVARELVNDLGVKRKFLVNSFECLVKASKSND